MDRNEYASPTPVTYRRLRLVSKVFAVLVIIIAVLVLIGWIFDVQLLKRIWSGNVAMNPVTAMGLIAAGSALIMRQESYQNRFRKQAQIVAAFLIFLGAFKIFLLISGLHFPFDQLLFRDDLWEPRYRIMNGIAPNTAVNFILIGSALMVINHETVGGHRPAQYFAIISSLLALVSLYGYVYQISALYTITTYLPMAPHTALSFLFLSFGTLFARPDKGTMSIVIGESSSQIIFMRFLAMVLPLIFGWLKLQGEKAGYYSTEAGTAMFAVLTYIVAMYLLGRRSVLQHKIRETKRVAMEVIKENERRLQAILDNSATNISLKTVLGKYTLVNKQFEKDFGLEAENVLNKTDYDLFPKEMARELNQYDHQVIRTGKSKSFEEKYPQEDGIHTYLTVKFPLFNQDQKIYALGAVSTDITKRKQLEDELRESEERYSLALMGTNDGLWDWNVKSNYLFLSKRWKNMLGYEENEIENTFQAWENQLHPDDLKKTTAVIMNYFAKKIPVYEVEFRMRHKDGSYRWMLDRGMALWDEDGKPYRMIGNQTDLTERKRLEEELRKSHQRLFGILDNLGEGVIVADNARNLIIFNRRAEEILGTSVVSAAWRDWKKAFEFCKPDGTPFRLAEMPLHLALKGIPQDNVEMFIRNEKIPDGRWLNVTGRPVKNELQEVIAGVIVFRDISLRKQLESLFSENEKRLKGILASIGEGIIIVNREEDLLLFNGKAEEILGHGPKDMPVASWPEYYGIFTPQEATLFPTDQFPLYLALQGQVTHNVEILVKNSQVPEGRNILMSGRPITDNKGHVTGAILDFKDITQQRKLEEYLKEIEEQFRNFLMSHGPAF